MQRSQPFAEVMTPDRTEAATVPNLAIYAFIAVFLAVFWLTVALVIF